MNTQRTHYDPILIALHWLMLLLFILTYASMELRGLFDKGTDGRAFMKTAHYVFGLSIFALFWLRLLVKNLTDKPQGAALPLWQRRLAGLTQALLYALMSVQPLLGWLLISAENTTVNVFGFTLPLLIAANVDTAHTLEEAHEIIATIGYVLIGLHTVAALFHYYVRKDGVMARMLPKLANKTT